METETSEIQDIEGNLVFAVAIAPERFPPEIKTNHFLQPSCREIWSVMERCRVDGRGWDLSILYVESTELGKRFLTDANRDVSAVMIPNYVDQLKKMYRKRIISMIQEELLEADGYVDPSKFQKRLLELLTQEEKDEAIHIKHAIKELLTDIEKTADDGVSGVTTGLDGLDQYFNGFRPSKLYILAARPSMGKSALMLNFALSAARNGKTVYVRALEESMTSFAARALSNDSGTDNEALQRGVISESKWQKIFESADRLSRLPIYINERSNVTPEEIYNSVKAFAFRTPIDMVYIDHIQDIKKKSDAWHHDISDGAARFKQLAKDLKIPVLVVSQLNRGVESRQDKRPMMSDMKESGDIEQKADVVMLLYRDGYYNRESDPGKTELIIAKNRDGRTGTFHMRWNSSSMKYYEE